MKENPFKGVKRRKLRHPLLRSSSPKKLRDPLNPKGRKATKKPLALKVKKRREKNQMAKESKQINVGLSFKKRRKNNA